MSFADDILDGLNEQQIEAVTAVPGPLLVTAGAGSGKTSVLIRRISYLIHEYDIPCYSIMAVTFTNKAAREMKNRIASLLTPELVPRRIGTFHSQANRFLRQYHEQASLPRDFTIMDMDDQKMVIKRLAQDKGFDYRAENWLKDIQNFINSSKENQLRSHDIDPNRIPRKFSRHNVNEFIEFYELYESECQSSTQLDFTELLLRSVEVMRNNELVRSEVQEKCRHLLIDEFQDTNPMQLEWLMLHCEKHKNVTAVGDEDQSIYGWRGAVPHSMMDFAKYFRNTKIIRLERNYRSSQTILDAANALIKNNKNRFDKDLWTDKQSKEFIVRFDARTCEDEAQYVGRQIQQMNRIDQLPYSSFAVLYRTNAQSRLFEEVFSYLRLPFRIYGGLRFYSRAEIKHVLSFLRLLVDRHANDAFRRIINVPPRSIGKQLIEKIERAAADQNLSLWDSTCLLAEDAAQTTRSRNALNSFIDLINDLGECVEYLSLSQIVDETIQRTALRDYYESRGVSELARVENLDEMINAAVNFMERSDGMSDEDTDGANIVFNYLDEVTIDAGDKHERDVDAVQVMTIHSAKGLEFPVVFLTGMDEQLLPHANAVRFQNYDSSALEEERRLCYVGMTRAEDSLIVTRAEKRRVFGQMTAFRPSRFIKEIPACHMKQSRPATGGYSSSAGNIRHYRSRH